MVVVKYGKNHTIQHEYGGGSQTVVSIIGVKDRITARFKYSHNKQVLIVL